MVQRDATFKIPVSRIWSGGWRLRNHPPKNWFERAFKTCTSAASSWIKNFKDQQINSNNTSAPGLLKWNGCPRLVVDEGILMTVNLFGRHPTWIATKCDQQKYPWLHIGFNVFGLMNSLLCLVWHISWSAPPFHLCRTRRDSYMKSTLILRKHTAANNPGTSTFLAISIHRKKNKSCRIVQVISTKGLVFQGMNLPPNLYLYKYSQPPTTTNQSRSVPAQVVERISWCLRAWIFHGSHGRGWLSAIQIHQ